MIISDKLNQKRYSGIQTHDLLIALCLHRNHVETRQLIHFQSIRDNRRIEKIINPYVNLI